MKGMKGMNSRKNLKDLLPKGSSLETCGHSGRLAAAGFLLQDYDRLSNFNLWGKGRKQKTIGTSFHGDRCRQLFFSTGWKGNYKSILWCSPMKYWGSCKKTRLKQVTPSEMRMLISRNGNATRRRKSGLFGIRNLRKISHKTCQMICVVSDVPCMNHTTTVSFV